MAEEHKTAPEHPFDVTQDDLEKMNVDQMRDANKEALIKFGGVQALARALKVDTENGLSGDATDVAARQEAYVDPGSLQVSLQEFWFCAPWWWRVGGVHSVPCCGLCCAVLCCAVLCCAVLCCAVLCCAGVAAIYLSVVRNLLCTMYCTNACLATLLTSGLARTGIPSRPCLAGGSCSSSPSKT